jgi:hypothetical protein
MTAPVKNDEGLVRTWALPPGARMGSSVREKGIYLEIRARLPVSERKSLTIKAGELVLQMPREATRDFASTSTFVSSMLEGIENLPIIPREIENILAISATERHRWLKDGRLPSAGTRTVKLRGRLKKITFHVFDPQVVRSILDGNLVDSWREDDAIRAAENRRRAAWKAKLKRTQNNDYKAFSPAEDDDQGDRFKLRGWAEFERDGPLR